MRWIGRVILAVALTAWAGAGKCAAKGIDLSLEAIYADPLGEFDIEGFVVDADGLLSEGVGALGSALWRIGEHLGVGAGFGYYKAHGGDLFDFVGADADLGVLPLHALVQYRTARKGPALILEAGLGYTHGVLDANGTVLGGFDLDTLDRTEGNLSVLGGAGFAYGVSESWALRAGVKYHHIFTENLSDNSVKFLLFTVGGSFGRP